MTDIFTKNLEMELKQFDEGVGSISAYATTYGNVDRVGDIIEAGSLDNFIRNFDGQLPMLVNHQSQQLPVGVWTALTSNEKGVIATGEFLNTTGGNDARTVVGRGLYSDVSIGFRALDFEMLDTGGRLFKEIELVELSIVQRPANPQATIESVKREDGSIDIKLLEKILRDAKLSRKESKTVLSNFLRNQRDAEKAKSLESKASQLKKLLEE